MEEKFWDVSRAFDMLDSVGVCQPAA